MQSKKIMRKRQRQKQTTAVLSNDTSLARRQNKTQAVGCSNRKTNHQIPGGLAAAITPNEREIEGSGLTKPRGVNKPNRHHTITRETHQRWDEEVEVIWAQNFHISGTDAETKGCTETFIYLFFLTDCSIRARN